MQIKIGYAIFFGITYFPVMQILNLCRPAYTHTHTCIYTHIHTHIHIHIHTHTYMHTYTHKHIHTLT